MQRTVINLRGVVQRVGLRAQIEYIASKLGVCGTVENLSDGSVLIVCEARQQVFDEMMRQIKKIPEPVDIKEIIIEEVSPATGMSGFCVLNFDPAREMLSAIRTGTAYLRKIDEKLYRIDENLCSVRDTQLEMRDTQLEMRDTQLEMRDTQLEMRDTQLEMRDTQLESNKTQMKILCGVESIDSKMDISLNNDMQILEILRSMRDGGLLQISK